MTALDRQAEAEGTSPCAMDEGRDRHAPSRTYLANALLALSSILMSTLAAEFALRAFPQFQVQTSEGEYIFCASSHVRHQPHPTFGYTEVPGNSYFERYSSVDPWGYVRINDQGFRDNYDNHGRPVIVLGDSMTRGSLVNENETYTDLLDHWYAGIFSFRNFGIGGYGQANSIRVYEEKGKNLDHQLVIQQYSLSTDLDDNVEDAAIDGDSVKIKVRPAVGTPNDEVKPLVRVHMFFRNHTKLYPWFHDLILRPLFSNWDARRNLDQALETTRRLLERLAGEARSNGADLLVLVLPSWAEMAGRNDGMEPQRQRLMIEKFAAETAGVFLLDATRVLATEDPDRVYGIVDKHLTPYGHFLVARALDRWLATEWPSGPKGAVPTRIFRESPPVVPDCSRAGDYLDQVKTPVSR